MTQAAGAGVPHEDTHQKALAINLDRGAYGTLAEIGAGQEVARWFLQVGGASGTVAKTISAYDMTFSDEIYGKVGRYVSRERLVGMLEKEYVLLQQRLGPTRGGETSFFVFADTVSARNFAGTNESHGWVGIRFQASPGGEPNDVLLHLNLLDGANLLQQQAVGIFGVNLIHAAFRRRGDLQTFLTALFDDLSPGRIEVDTIHVNGPAFANVDERNAVLELVRQGLTEAVLVSADGTARPPSEVIRKRPLVLEPGVFAEVSAVHSRILAAARRELEGELRSTGQEPLALFALTTRRPSEPIAETEELRRRLDHLLALGTDVLVAGAPEVYRLVGFAMRYTKEPIRLAIGIATLAQLLLERQYDHLDGQVLEALGKLFAFNVRVYAYATAVDDFRRATDGTPIASWIDLASGKDTIDTGSLRPPRPVAHLYAYLVETGFLRSIGP
jgi:hypothetical protein